jgi:hypothetical protein
MTASHLTDSEEELWSSMVGVLTGYTYSPLTQSRSEYLETVADGLTSGSYDNLTTSYNGLLAIIATELTGSLVSHLTSSGTAMMAAIINNPPDGDAAPTDIQLSASAVIEDAPLGTVIGTLSVTDPGGASVTFSITSDASGKFGIEGANLVVHGVFDYEIATSHAITIRATDDAANTYDEAFNITVTDVTETPSPDPLPPGDDEDDGNFDTPPYTVEVDGSVKLGGTKKPGSIAKFVHNIIADMPLTAGHVYTMEYDPDFTQMSAGGVLAMVGFMFKAGNDFWIVGLRGDGSTGIHAYEVQGDNLWNLTAGFVVDDGGAALNGTQAGPNWIQLEISSDGAQITFRTSGDEGDTWDDEYTGRVPMPFTNVSQVTAWGPGAFFHGDDDGPYSISVSIWTDELAVAARQVAFLGGAFVVNSTARVTMGAPGVALISI